MIGPLSSLVGAGDFAHSCGSENEAYCLFLVFSLVCSTIWFLLTLDFTSARPQLDYFRGEVGAFNFGIRNKMDLLSLTMVKPVIWTLFESTGNYVSGTKQKLLP